MVCVKLSRIWLRCVNRMTPEAIRVTQSDRDLFKHLISGYLYVAADYMRHANERRKHLDGALVLRNELLSSRKQLSSEQYRHVEMARELAEQSGSQSDLEKPIIRPPATI